MMSYKLDADFKLFFFFLNFILYELSQTRLLTLQIFSSWVSDLSNLLQSPFRNEFKVWRSDVVLVISPIDVISWNQSVHLENLEYQCFYEDYAVKWVLYICANVRKRHEEAEKFSVLSSTNILTLMSLTSVWILAGK